MEEDGDLDAATSCRKKFRQSRVGRYAGNFGPEKNVGKFGPEKMPVISDRNKMSANSSWKKCRQVWAEKKMAGVFGRGKLPQKRQLPAN